MISYTRTKVSCYIGYIVQAIVNNLLPLFFLILQTDYSLTYEALGRLILINFCVQIAVDIVSVKAVNIIGYRTTVVLSHALAALGLAMLGVLPMIFPQNVYICLVASICVYATGSGIIEVIISPLVEYLPTKNKSAQMCFLHSFYCWGQVFCVIVTTLLIRFLTSGNWMLVPIFWAIIPFINMFSFINAPFVIPKSETEHTNMKIGELLKTPRFYKLLTFMLCAGVCEMAVAQWSSMFAEQALHVSKVVGDLLGPCAFALFMGTGRIIYGFFGNRISMNLLITVNAALCSVCYITIALSASPVVCLAACAVCGFSVSLMWPGTYSVAAQQMPKGGTAMYGLLAMLGDIGCSLGPWLTGLVADVKGLQAGFLVTSLFPVVLFLASGRDAIIKKNKEVQI